MNGFMGQSEGEKGKKVTATLKIMSQFTAFLRTSCPAAQTTIKYHRALSPGTGNLARTGELARAVK